MNLSYKYLTPSLLAILFGLSAPCLADTVNIGVSGNLYGAYSLSANQSVSETFTLNQNTAITSLNFGVQPEIQGMMMDGSFQVIVSGASGIVYVLDEQTVNGSPNYQITTPLPNILAAGNYDITFDGGACGTPCYGFVAGIDYYDPATYIGLGGSAQGPFGFVLTGQTLSDAAALELAQNNVPEPGSLVLAGTALAILPMCLYRRRRT